MINARKRSWRLKLMVPIIMSGLLFTPLSCFAIGDAGVIIAIHALGHMLQSYMLQRLHQFSQEQTSKMIDKEEDIFKQKTNWEKWPASLRETVVEQSVKLEDQSNQVSYKNAQDYLRGLLQTIFRIHQNESRLSG